MSGSSGPVAGVSKTGPVPAVGYLRVSTGEQAESGYGLEVQRRVVEEFCRREGLSLVAVDVDPGVPGTTALEERIGLSTALARVDRGEARVLAVARFDRLARETLTALMIERTFRQAGAGVMYAEGLNGEGPTIEFMREVMHSMATFERKALVSRLAAARVTSGHMGGRPPFGYRSKAGLLYPEPEEAKTVKWIFAKVAEGKTIRQVSRLLNHEQTLGRTWRQSDVWRILKRDDYRRGPSGARIVDGKVWWKAQAMLTKRRKS